MEQLATFLLLRQHSRSWAGCGVRGGGFSLIELMVAIVLLMLILLVGMPTFSGILANLRVRGVAEATVSGLQWARTEATRRNQPIVFDLVAEDGGGWEVKLAADDTILQSRSANDSEGILVEPDLTLNDGEIAFGTLGQRTDPAGGVLTIVVSKPSSGACQPSGSVRCLNILVQPSGQIRMCDPQRASGDPQACS